MPPLDANIALQVKPPQFENRLAQYGQVMQIQQAQNLNRLADIQYRQALQGEADQQTLRALPPGATLEQQQNALRAIGKYKEANELETAALTRRKTMGEITKQDADEFTRKLGIVGGALVSLGQAPSREAVMGTLEALQAQGIKPPPIPLPADDAQLPAWVRQVATLTKDGLDKLKAYQPQVHMTDTGGVVQPTNTNALAGPVGPLQGTNALVKSQTPDSVATDTRVVSEGALNRDQAQRNADRTDQRLRDNNATAREASERGKWVNDFERGLQVNMADGATRPMTAAGVPVGGKKDEKREEAKDKARLGAEMAGTKARVVIDKVDEALKRTKFFTTGLTGTGLGIVPGTNAYDLEQTLDTIKANVGFKELADMRAASPTGGALGQITVRELEFLQAAIASLSKGQSEKLLRENLNQVKKHFNNWRDAMDEAAGNRVQKSPQNPGRVQSGKVGGVDPSKLSDAEIKRELGIK